MMAPLASLEEGYGKELVHTSPAAPNQQQVLIVDERKKEIEEALASLKSCRSRCSEMLEAARQYPSMIDLELRCLDFLEKDLRYLITFVTALSPQHAHEGMMEWLRHLTVAASTKLIPGALDEADPQQRHTMRRRAVQCFLNQRHQYTYWLRPAVELSYRLAGNPLRYEYPLSATQHYRPPLGIKGWFRRSSPYWIIPSETISLLALYMIMFPYGYVFEKDRLVIKWLYEGIFNVEEGKGRLDSYFFNLFDQNVITHATAANFRRNNPDKVETWQWNVDGLQYHFLASKSAEIGFVFTINTLYLLVAAPATDHGNETSRIPRRLALHRDNLDILALLQPIDLSETRSLAVSRGVSIGVPFDKFVNLVVLDVQGWVNFEDEDLLRLCRSKMFFLEYLSIRSTRVRKLPPEIKELCSLEILDASCTLVTELPIEVFVATRLRRLDIRDTPIRQLTLPKQILGLQETLSALLLGSEETVNSTETTVTRPPHDIRRFRNLETLATVDLSEQPASFIINSLGDLKHLRVLAITWSFHQTSDGDYCEALLSTIKRWCHLESLTIHCGLGCSMDFLGCLSGIPLTLETFKVTVGRFSGVPKWFHLLRYLSFVQITVCKLGAHDLEILGGLPKLKRLILSLDFIAGEAIVIENKGFHELQRFSVECPVPWLTFVSKAMPKLTYLQLDFRACPTRAFSVPSGISNLSNLKEVALWYNERYANSSSVKMTVQAVRKEVAKCRNATKMFSLFINGLEQYDY